MALLDVGDARPLYSLPVPGSNDHPLVPGRPRPLDPRRLFGDRPPPAVLERWAEACGALVAEARALGIPEAAIPDPPSMGGPEPLTEARLREYRQHLRDMVDSFLCSGL